MPVVGCASCSLCRSATTVPHSTSHSRSARWPWRHRSWPGQQAAMARGGARDCRVSGEGSEAERQVKRGRERRRHHLPERALAERMGADGLETDASARDPIPRPGPSRSSLAQCDDPLATSQQPPMLRFSPPRVQPQGLSRAGPSLPCFMHG